MRGFAKAVLILAMTTCSAGLAAQEEAQPREFPTAPFPVLEDRYPQQVQTWPDGVTSLSDVTFSTINGYRPLAMDIYMPPRGTPPRPLIVHVHGGGWSAGHTRHAGATANFPALLASLASEGFVVASIEYRLSGEAQSPAQLQDVRAAVRYLRSNADLYGVDPERVGIWGGSAGGHLSALAATTCGNTELDAEGIEAEPGSECLQAAAIWYGVFDFGALAAGRPGGNDGAGSALFGCEGPCSAQTFAEGSPVTYMDAGDPPMLLIHGEEDAVVPVSQSHIAEERLNGLGVPVEAIYIPGTNHSFIGASPEITRAATLQALNATFDFFHQILDGENK